MKYPVYIIGQIFGLISLFSLQLCILKYEQGITLNLLLIAYSYAIFAQAPLAITTSLVLLLDAFNFLITGYIGFTSIILTLASIGIMTIKDNFYNKLIMPITCIITYHTIEFILFHATLHYRLNPEAILISSLLDSIFFIGIWWLTKQPLHD
jgi:hypothetical protein